MSQNKDFDHQEESVTAAWRRAARDEPSADINARILALANKQAEETRSRQQKVAPFSHSRTTYLSIAASVVLAVSVVVVMQIEKPDEIGFEQSVALSDTMRQHSEQLHSEKRQEEVSKQEAPSLTRSESEPQADAFAEQDIASMDSSAMDSEIMQEAMPTPELRAAVAPDRFSADKSAPATAMSGLSAQAPAHIERKRARQAPIQPTLQPVTPAVTLVNIADAALLKSAETDFLILLHSQSKQSMQAYLALWDAKSRAVIERTLMQNDNWENYQHTLNTARIIARIDADQRVIFVFDNKRDSLGQHGTLTLRYTTDTFQLDMLPLEQPGIMDQINSLPR